MLLKRQTFPVWPGPYTVFLSRGGGGVLPYKALMGTCGQPGYVFRDFCLEQGIEFIIFVLIRVTIYQFLS